MTKQEQINKLAAKMYHIVYPKSNWFKLDTQSASVRGFTELATKLIERKENVNN